MSRAPEPSISSQIQEVADLVRPRDLHATTLVIFAKPPLPGLAKSRLAAAIGPEAAALLARAFLIDVVAAARDVGWARPVLATTGPMPDDLDAALAGLPQWPQGPGDLGDRMERALARAIAESGSGIVIGTDSPGMPGAVLEDAARLLRTNDAVLGPAEDGGYTLIGLTRCEPGLLTGLPWSAADTLAATRARLLERSYRVALAPAWFDVDHHDDLARLAGLLRSGEVRAPATAQALDALGLLHGDATDAAGEAGADGPER